MAEWRETEDFGRTEGGVVGRHEECWMDEPAISLERDCKFAPVAITCGVYGWLVHTRYCCTVPEGEAAFEDMKPALVALLHTVRNGDDSGQPFEALVERYASCSRGRAAVRLRCRTATCPDYATGEAAGRRRRAGTAVRDGLPVRA